MTKKRSVQCSAHTTSSGGQARCGRQAVIGATVCASHGGRAPQVREAAAARVEAARVEAQAGKLLSRYEVVPVTNPLRRLSELAGELDRFLAVTRELVDRIGEHTAKFQGLQTRQLAGEVAVYERAMDRCARILTDMARMDIDARLSNLDERDGARVADVIYGVLYDLNLTPDQFEAGRSSAARRLRELDKVISGG